MASSSYDVIVEFGYNSGFAIDLNSIKYGDGKKNYFVVEADHTTLSTVFNLYDDAREKGINPDKRFLIQSYSHSCRETALSSIYSLKNFFAHTHLQAPVSQTVTHLVYKYDDREPLTEEKTTLISKFLYYFSVNFGSKILKNYGEQPYSMQFDIVSSTNVYLLSALLYCIRYSHIMQAFLDEMNKDYNKRGYNQHFSVLAKMFYNNIEYGNESNPAFLLGLFFSLMARGKANVTLSDSINGPVSYTAYRTSLSSLKEAFNHIKALDIDMRSLGRHRVQCSDSYETAFVNILEYFSLLEENYRRKER